MKSLMRRVVRFAFVSGVACGGYLIGKYESPESGSGYWKEKLLSEILVIPSVLATSSLINDDLHRGPTDNLPDVEKGMTKTNTVETQHRNRISEIMKYGFPSLDNIRSYDNFVLSYDKRNRVANWVFEHLTRDTVKRNDQVDRSKCDFHEDVSIHPYFRATNADYKRSGFDRGHLAAAGNHKANQKTCEQTFVLSNMAPQVGEGFNRSAWNRLEKYVRSLVRKCNNVYVCTGPLYLPRVEGDGKSYIKYQVIGANTVAVPTHFFKVILMEHPDSSLEMESYVMPNQPIGDDVPLHNFQVPIESIERASGLLLFDKVQRKSLKRLNGKGR